MERCRDLPEFDCWYMLVDLTRILPSDIRNYANIKAAMDFIGTPTSTDYTNIYHYVNANGVYSNYGYYKCPIKDNVTVKLDWPGAPTDLANIIKNPWTYFPPNTPLSNNYSNSVLYLQTYVDKDADGLPFKNKLYKILFNLRRATLRDISIEDKKNLPINMITNKYPDLISPDIYDSGDWELYDDHVYFAMKPGSDTGVVISAYMLLQTSPQFWFRNCIGPVQKALMFVPSIYHNGRSPSCDTLCKCLCNTDEYKYDKICGCYQPYVDRYIISKYPELGAAAGFTPKCAKSCNTNAYIPTGPINCILTICKADVKGGLNTSAKIIQDCGPNTNNTPSGTSSSPSPSPSPIPAKTSLKDNEKTFMIMGIIAIVVIIIIMALIFLVLMY